jgi:hypothetical protein
MTVKRFNGATCEGTSVTPESSAIAPDRASGRLARRSWPRRLPLDFLQYSGRFANRAGGLTSRRASYVVSCTMGTSWSRARSADSSLSEMLPSPWRRRSSAGVTSTIPIFDFASPLSISRSNGVPSATSFSLNQTLTPSASRRSCSSLAVPCRSSHAWQRKTSRRSGTSTRLSTLSRIGVSARTSAGVYTSDELAGDQRGLALLPDPPLLLPPLPLLTDEG